ncbi:MAG: N-acetylmuramoyl-L-alanine amidase [Firmicutes bacterium]|nr:N-acetylmuramoyl-L-alanine amidase [Bacillota bacterium]
MRDIADIVKNELMQKGITVHLGHKGTGNVVEANALNPQPTAYVALHSNGEGGKVPTGKTRGTLIFTKNDELSNRLGKLVMEKIIQIAPSETRNGSGILDGNKANLYECKKPKMPTILIEYGYHDNIEDATWILNNKALLARQTAQGIASYLRML